jgi:hypothetical protein
VAVPHDTRAEGTDAVTIAHAPGGHHGDATGSAVDRRTAFHFGPASLDVRVATGDDTDRWLEAFLAPAMAAGAPADSAPADSGLTVHARSSARECDEVDARAASASRRLACFAFDSRLVMFPGWDAGASTLVADTARSCFYRLHDHGVEVVGRPGQRGPRIGLMRVVREILTVRRRAREAALDTHAAAFRLGERVVVLAGNKRSGKTTLLCHALASGRTALVANDRVFLTMDGDAVAASGVPTLVAVRPQSRQFIAALRREEPPEGVGTRVGTSLAQLAAQLSASCVAGAPLGAVVFPEISDHVSTWQLEPLPPEEGMSRLLQCSYGPRGRSARTVFEERYGVDVAAADGGAIISRSARTVPFFRCILGPRAYEAGPDAWLEALAAL